MSNKPVTTGAETKDSKKLGVFSTAMIGIAFAISLNLFSAGTSYTASFSRSLIAIFITWIALAAVWILFGLMGQMTGRSAADIYRFSFGSKGYKIPSAIIVVCTVFWALFDYWYVGAAVRNMMPNNPDLGFAIGMLIITGAVILGIIKEITSLKILSTLTSYRFDSVHCHSHCHHFEGRRYGSDHELCASRGNSHCYRCQYAVQCVYLPEPRVP